MVDTTVQPRVHTSSDVRLRSRCSGASVVASAVGSTTVSFVRQLVTSCAVDGGLLAATRGASASHVTSLQGTRPLTTRGMEEGGTWFQERNGRKVLKLKLGSSGCQIPVLEGTKTETEAKSKSSKGQEHTNHQGCSIVCNSKPDHLLRTFIWVLQDALRKAVDRAAAAESKLKEASCGSHLSTALTDARTKYWEQRTHDMTDLASQLEDTKRKLQRSERKRESYNWHTKDELSAAVGKLGRVRKKYKAGQARG